MKKKNITLWIFFLIFLVQCAEKRVVPGPPAPITTKPNRLLILVFDQMPSDCANRFDLKNFKKLAEIGTHFSHAYVGHLTSSAAVSNAVVNTGLFPSNLSWQNAIMRDTEGLFGPKKRLYLVADLSQKQFSKLEAVSEQSSLMFRLKLPPSPKDKNTTYPIFSISQKASSSTSNAVIEFMKKEPSWRAVFASFNSTNKKLADEELGHILTELENQKILSETLIIVTALSGEQEGSGVEFKYFNYGKGENFSFFPSDDKQINSLTKVIKTGLIEAATRGSYLSFWLKKRDRTTVARFGDLTRDLANVTEIYTRHDTGNSSHYVRTYRSSEVTGPELEWAKMYHQELVTTMVNKNGPEVLALLGSREAQEYVQKIPFYLVAPNLNRQGMVVETPVRLVDINPIVTRFMGLSPVSNLDGSATAVEDLIFELNH